MAVAVVVAEADRRGCVVHVKRWRISVIGVRESDADLVAMLGSVCSMAYKCDGFYEYCVYVDAFHG